MDSDIGTMFAVRALVTAHNKHAERHSVCIRVITMCPAPKCHDMCEWYMIRIPKHVAVPQVGLHCEFEGCGRFMRIQDRHYELSFSRIRNVRTVHIPQCCGPPGGMALHDA